MWQTWCSYCLLPRFPLPMQKENVLALPVCLIAQPDWIGDYREKYGNTRKNMEREFLQLRNNLVNSEDPVLLQKRIQNLS